MPHDVFISYSSQDKKAADAICARFESEGIRCWIAPRDVPTGAKWPPTILAAIRQSRAFVLVFSKASNESDEVENEVRSALDAKLPVLPFKIEPAEYSDAMQFMLANRHWLDALTPPLEAHIAELAAQVHALLGNSRSTASHGSAQNQQLAKDWPKGTLGPTSPTSPGHTIAPGAIAPGPHTNEAGEGYAATFLSPIETKEAAQVLWDDYNFRYEVNRTDKNGKDKIALPWGSIEKWWVGEPTNTNELRMVLMVDAGKAGLGRAGKLWPRFIIKAHDQDAIRKGMKQHAARAESSTELLLPK
jgi:hypothetical protein